MFTQHSTIKAFYHLLSKLHTQVRTKFNRKLTLTEKILFSHMREESIPSQIIRGETDLNLYPDRIAMQDATAQMAILQFMTSGMKKTVVPTTIHCDHLIQAFIGATQDLTSALDTNQEVYDFLRTAASTYGMGFWRPGSGIIHQVILENYAVPGTMMIGTDSHTPNAGGLGMIAIGVGGADAVDVMTGQAFGLKMPKIVGIHLKGKLSGWASPKDVIIKVAQIMTVKGGTGKVIEYFGEGTKHISCTGKATISNMGAEIGATTSIFPYDESMARYLKYTDRQDIAKLAQEHSEQLVADPEVYQNPQHYFDEIHEIHLSELEPHVAGPHSPDAVTPISTLANKIRDIQAPEQLSAALIGSCTNSSYEDLTRAVSLVRQALKAGLKVKSKFLITPGSERIYETITRDGILQDFEHAGGLVLANACGPCIGQWKREDKDINQPNNIITSFNRNFKKRNDGSAHTNSFVASPEIVVAMSFAGTMTFNPLTDALTTPTGKSFRFEAPQGEELPQKGFSSKNNGYIAPQGHTTILIQNDSERLAFLEPFPKPDLQNDFQNMLLLVKAAGKCTTDHISQAGPWLKYRGHLDKISQNMYLGAVNAFTSDAGKGLNVLTQQTQIFHEIARHYKHKNISWCVVADENYGEGSSREHAAMEPRHLGGKAIIAKSFARIAEANLKKQGILPLTFTDKNDYTKFQEHDRITILHIDLIAPNLPLVIELQHSNTAKERITVTHTLNPTEIEWFKAGSALNFLKQRGSHIET